MAIVLLVDDQPNLLLTYRVALERVGHRVVTAMAPGDAYSLFEREQPEVVIIGNDEDGTPWKEFCDPMRSRSDSAEYIILIDAAAMRSRTGRGDVNPGVDALKSGAFGYVDREIPIPEALLLLVEKAALLARLRSARDRSTRPSAIRPSLDQFTSTDPRMNESYAVCRKVAPTDSTLLFLGEVGSGKRMMAEAIHKASRRGSMPFIEVNCSLIPREQQESKLFGEVRVSDIHSDAAERGLFDEAQGGTIYFEEIADMDISLQAKLLRFLQDHRINRVGDNKVFGIDLRILCSTRRDLSRLVSERVFREDLFYRINVLSIPLVPLRQRPGDIPKLANEFLQQASLKVGKPMRALEKEALDCLLEYRWPCNLIELRNCLEYAVIHCESEAIGPQCLPAEVRGKSGRQSLFDIENLTLDELERRYILDTLRACKGSRSETSARLGLSTTTLWRRLKQYGIESEDEITPVESSTRWQ